MWHLKYRPQHFSELVGNTEKWKYLVDSFPDWPSSFLITGPAGTGKTTLSRIIAKQLGCDKPDLNLFEIDAAQDRGIDNIREITRTSRNRPLVGPGKVYILDEAHQITNEAQVALLKVTEEPPPKTYFILCSTDPRKISSPLRTRCKRGEIQLNPLSDKELGNVLKRVLDGEGIVIDDRIREIAKLCIHHSEGSPRNVIMLMEKYKDYSVDDVKKTIDVSEFIDEDVLELMKAVDKRDKTAVCMFFTEYKKANWESLRIIMGQIYKKRILKRNGDAEAMKVLSAFQKPVDNNIGDIELVYRIMGIL